MNNLFETTSKPFPVTKLMVKEAYRKVKSNKGSAGVDGQDFATFDANLLPNLYKLWNRMASGSYFPQPVKEVIIPKTNGGERKLGIPTIADRIAQEVVKAFIEPRLEAVFLPNSYGYRPHKSTHQALEQVRQNVRHHAWVIDMDIQSFFDEVNHELLLKAVSKHVVEKWVLLYIKRWLQTPVQTKTGLVEKDGKGTPQGGVISPLLANLFLHYVLDKWLQQQYPGVTFVRYADDIVVHCNSETQSHQLLQAIRVRLTDCKLSLSEEKTKIAYCQNYSRPIRKDYPKQFDFSGFSFKPATKKSKRDGGLFLGFDCVMSLKSQTRILRNWKQLNFHRNTPQTLQDIAHTLNPQIIGVINYFGKFAISGLHNLFRKLNDRIAKWVRNKYKSTKRSYLQAYNWLRDIKSSYPNLFRHWQIFSL